MKKNKIRIANAGGFWGDDLNALRRQLEGGEVDYITSDYLAEITMSILRKQQLKNPKLGYISDFVDQMTDVAELLLEKKVRMITNAGGINPLGCAQAILQNLAKKGVNLKIAIVEGDNIYEQISSFYPDKANFKNMETGEPFSNVQSKLQSANAYLGVPPLLKALETGADLILAGRVTDTSITMAPMIYEFGWKLNDWDKLASALVAGHIIECGAQSTGGNFTDWHLIKNWENMGYPIVEVNDDATFVVTKHNNTGGMVSLNTVKEQLVYEMGSPSNYISPDVVADFLSIQLAEDGENRVRVSGIKGKPSTKFLKVSMAYEDGYKATAAIMISGPNAKDKAEIFVDAFWKRLGIDFEKKNAEFIGYNACHKNLAADIIPNEIYLRFNVFDKDPNKLETFAKSIAPMILSGPSGVCVTGGRPSPMGVMTYYPTLVPKSLIETKVSRLNLQGEIVESHKISSITGFEEEMDFPEITRQVSNAKPTKPEMNRQLKIVKLKQICLARSGDKGDMANIGVVARNKDIYDYLKEFLTADLVKFWFSELCKGKVIRYELDNLNALNFLLEESLDGGGTKSLMIDAQGKTFASALLNCEISIDKSLLKNI
jgi:hypothetical protein